MKSKLLDNREMRSFAVVFDTGEEVSDGLLRFAKQNDLTGASFTAIGAFQDATLAFFDLESKAYLEIPVAEQVEVLSLVGNITTYRGEPKLHAHAVVGRRDGTTRGGHLLHAHVRPTLEVVVTETPAHLRRERDAETGLPLIELGSDEQVEKRID